MKKVFVCVLALALAVALCACVPGTAEGTPTPTATPEPTQTVEPTPAPTPSPTPEPTTGPLDISREPPLDEFSLSVPVPDFLTEEQQLLYRRAGTLYRMMKSGETSAVDRFPEVQGQTYADGVEINGYLYVKALGRYRSWVDFEGLMLSVFTPELWASLNSLYDGNPIYINVDGTMHFVDLGMGIGNYYNGYFPDEFILQSSSDTAVTFLLVGHYVYDAYPQAGESVEECEARLAGGYDYTLEFPIQLVLTENGWRFSSFYDTFCDERKENG